MGNQGIMGVHGNGYANGLKLKESKRHSENAPPKKLVKIKGVSRTFEVPCDQKSPLSVRNVYSPIGYGIRRKQRVLEEQRKSRTQEILEQCSNLFDSSEDNSSHLIKKSNRSVSKTSSEDRYSDEISYGRHSENCCAVAAFVMSVHPSFPAANRPTISLKVRQSLVELFGGTDLCFLSNDGEDSLVCTAVLQLTKISDVYEGSIVIYKGYDRSVVHSYVPLASVRSITRGLEPQDRELYNKSNGILRCKTDCNEVFEVELKRSFTLHYYFPTNFYASFVAFSDDDLGKWMDVVVSGATIVKETLSSLNIPLNMMGIFTLTWFKRNWKFLLYFLLLRKLYKMIAFRKIWKRLSIRSAIRSNPQKVDAGDSLLLKDGTDAPKNTPMNSEKTSIFRCMERQQPSTNQVIMADGMILVNRNDRYLEVYERRKVSKVDNIDEQVEALLQQFLPVNQKKP